MSTSSAFISMMKDIETALGCEVQYKKIWKGSKLRSNGVYVKEVDSGYLVFSRKVDFSISEKNFIKKVIDSYDSLSRNINTRGVAYQYFQTSIIASVMSIAISKFISSRENFLNVFHIIQWMIQISHEKYEGEQVKTGLFVQKTGGGDERSPNYEFIPLASPIKLNHNIVHDTAFLRYVDGVKSFYCSDASLQVSHYVNVDDAKINPFELMSGKLVEKLMKHLGDVYFYIGVSSSSDVEIILNDNIRILYRKGKWYFIDCSVINIAIMDGEHKSLLWRIIYSLSKIRKGAVILKIKNDLILPDKFIIGHIGEDKDMLKSFARRFHDTSISDLSKTGELLRILTTDGMLIVDSNFNNIVDHNVIIDTSQAKNISGGGGRTTAAISASRYGVSVKVSEDGPISIYKDTEKVYCVG